MSRQALVGQARGPRIRALWLSWLAYASYYLGRKGLSVSKAALVRAGLVSEGALAAIDTGYLAAYALGQVPSGVLADRFGARRVIAVGLLGSSLACLGFGASTSAALLFACFCANGLFQASGWPATTKVVADHTTPLERGRVMGWWSTCYQVGGIAATALATYLLAAHGVRSVFFVPASVLAVLSVVIWSALPERPSGTDGAASGAAAPAVSKEAARAQLLRLLRDLRVLCYGASYFCIKLIRYSLLFWLPYYLHTAAGFDEVLSGYLSTSFEIGGVLGTIALGWYSDRAAWGRATIAAGTLFCLALALVLYALLPSGHAALHFGAMALVGALLFGPDALISGAAAQDLGGTHAAATAVGVVNGLGSAGALLQGAVTLAVQRAFGWQALFWAFVALSLVALGCLLPAVLAERPRPRPAAPTEARS